MTLKFLYANIGSIFHLNIGYAEGLFAARSIGWEDGALKTHTVQTTSTSAFKQHENTHPHTHPHTYILTETPPLPILCSAAADAW